MYYDETIQFAQLVQAAYAVAANDLTQRTGQTIANKFDPLGRNYEIITSIYGNDLATDANRARGAQTVSYGFVAQDASGGVVLALRGTEGILEWLHDAAFLQVPCPFLAGAGNSEDGFTAIYSSLSVDSGLANALVTGLAGLAFKQAVTSVTVCGHSLGGALTSLLAMDMAANTKFKPAVYSYASPRVGDSLFANTYNALVPDTFRIANRLDIVPKLPLEHPLPPFPAYTHVNTLVPLNSTAAFPPQIAMTLRCEHILASYLFLVGQNPGVTIRPTPALDVSCDISGLAPEALFS